MSQIDPKYIEEARERLIVALDVAEVEQARELVRQLGDEVTFYKIGLRLLVKGGQELALEMREKNKNVFLDYKFHDIGAQVEWAAESAAALKGSLLTIHSYPEVMAAAVKARDIANAKSAKKDRLRVIAVTILTSLSEDDLKSVGIKSSVKHNVIKRALSAKQLGCDGVVASALEAREIRRKIPDQSFIIVTPGIRPEGAHADDQKRIATPFEAIKSGASYLVVGRPITSASDPKAAARKIIREMAEAIIESGGASTSGSAANSSASKHTDILRKLDGQALHA